MLFVRHPKGIVCRAGNAGGRLSSVSDRRSWSASDANSKALVYDMLPWRTVPESKACSLDRVCRVSNWILTSCQPHRVTSGQRPSVLTQLIGVDSRKRHTVLFVFQQPTAPPINQPTNQSKTVSKQVCNKPTNNPAVFQSKNNKNILIFYFKRIENKKEKRVLLRLSLAAGGSKGANSTSPKTKYSRRSTRAKTAH